MSISDFWKVSTPCLILVCIADIIQIIFLLLARGKPLRIYNWLAILTWIPAEILGTLILILLFVTPFIIYIIWGAIVIGLDSVPDHGGLALLFLPISIHSLVISATIWKTWKYRVTPGVVLFGVISIIFMIGYMMATIWIPDYFSYTGITIVFKCLSLIFVCLIHFFIDNFRNWINLDLFIKRMSKTKFETDEVITQIKFKQRII